MITTTDIEQDWKNGYTRVWFDVNDVQYAISVSGNEYSLIDSEGYPIDPCNDRDGLLDTLTPLAIKKMTEE